MRIHLASIGEAAAIAAVAVFAVNLSLFVILQTLKKTSRRGLKIKLAKLSRKMMKIHVFVGITGTALIAVHIPIMLALKGHLLGFGHIKLVSGYVAAAGLAVNLFAGWLRRQRASGPRRKFHLYTALFFACLFILHILLPGH